MSGCYNRKKSRWIVVLLIFCALKGYAQPAALHPRWIWYPDDYEIWLHKEVSLRRIQRTNVFPPFYRLDAPYGNIKFIREVALSAPEQIYVKATGTFSVQNNWEFLKVNHGWVTLPKGRYRLSVNVINYDSLPCLWVQGATLASDSSWKVTCYNDQEVPAGFGNFDNPGQTPLHFPFRLEEIRPVAVSRTEKGVLLDFGKETFGYLKLGHLRGQGAVNIYYGESREEALSSEYAEIHDSVQVPGDSVQSFTLNLSRGLRYIHVVAGAGVEIGDYSLLYEYLPQVKRGAFHCSNDTLNRIWQTAAYTLELTTREFMLDGIKRDRWVWGGDARESFLMNYYLYFNQDVNKRTMVALRGKDPIEIMINHIPDYSMYWLLSLEEYYQYTGDSAFIERMYPKIVSMTAFLCSRLSESNLFVGKPGDNLFVDWAGMDKSGVLSFYQLLFARSMEAFATCARVAGDINRAQQYDALAADMKRKTIQLYWNDSLGALMHEQQSNGQFSGVNRYANMFAVLFDYLDSSRQQRVKQHVLLNDSIQKITTPYMRFYELAALCKLGAHPYVTRQVLDYWGGMLALGATTFWEVYDPREKGAEHYAMYGHPFERSLCHAWGASPVYLMGKYYLGVQPLAAGFERFEVSPHLGGLKWIEGTVPTAKGNVQVFMDHKTITVYTTATGGVLTFFSKTKPRSSAGAIKALGRAHYQITIIPDKKMVIRYQSTDLL